MTWYFFGGLFLPVATTTIICVTGIVHVVLAYKHLTPTVLDPDHEPKNPKNLEAFFLETFLGAKPRTGMERLLTNRIIRILYIRPMEQCYK